MLACLPASLARSLPVEVIARITKFNTARLDILTCMRFCHTEAGLCRQACPRLTHDPTPTTDNPFINDFVGGLQGS